jgi:dTDP-4-amino-4,6-dideoxygalactose transaminase
MDDGAGTTGTAHTCLSHKSQSQIGVPDGPDDLNLGRMLGEPIEIAQDGQFVHEHTRAGVCFFDDEAENLVAQGCSVARFKNIKNVACVSPSAQDHNLDQQLTVTYTAHADQSQMERPARKALTASRIESLVRSHRFEEPVMVTRPTMPPLSEYTRLLEGIWDRRWLTNDGILHRELEEKLGVYLGVDHLSLFNNGATALLVMLQALRINTGEVITTPFTFPASAHVIHWNRVRPVFCDIDEQTFNIDPRRIESLIGSETRAIMGVHVYGNPCDVDAIQAIADRHGLLVVYDAAHAFGVRRDDRSILEAGNMAMLSFHATKVFSSIEGGALVSRSQVERDRVNSLKNFGIADEETIIGPGINGKMNEFQAAFGLLRLRGIDDEIACRKALARSYREHLADLRGIRFLEDIPGVRHNYAYFPIVVDERKYGMTRDDLHALLKQFNVNTRKYFYPLVSHAPCYSALPSADSRNLPVAERISRQVLCLPIYGTLDPGAPKIIAEIIRELHGNG